MLLSTSLPDDVKEVIRSKTDIVALIGETVSLQPRYGGRLFVGLCPFHEDHNPSFNVNPERQTYRCWVCQKGGDCFSYMMEADRLSFRDALEYLANRAGVELPKHRGGERLAPDERTALYEVLDWAATEFQRCLHSAVQGARALNYLRDRQFTADTIARFQLGYAAEGWSWLLERARGRFSTDLLVKAGLAKANEPPRQGFRDAYVDRVMFPIRDERGRMISFGGRILPDSKQQNTGKYINGSDTAVFHKSKVIFGFDQARDAIRRTGTAVVTEGYVDCIKAHQAGVVNAVGTLGTALTETHVSMLKRSARRVVLVYDGDKAGQDAAGRSVEKFLAQDVDLRILSLPDELDPDEFLDAHGVQAFEELIEQAPEAWEYVVRRSLATNGSSVDGLQKSLEEMLQLLTLVPGMRGSTRETLLVSRIAQRLHLREPVVRQRLQEIHSGRTASPKRKSFAVDSSARIETSPREADVLSLQRSRSKDDQLETELLQILFTAPHTIEQIRQEVGTDDFRHEVTRELLGICFDIWELGEHPEFSRVLDALECPHLKSLAVWIDEQAAARRLSDLLAQDAVVRSSEAPQNSTTGGGLLRQIINQLKWRREVERQSSTQGRIATQLSSAAGLSPELRELLAQQTRFHQQRVKKPQAPGTENGA